VVIAEAHKLVAEAFKHLLEPEFEVVGIALDGHALVQSVGRLKPDVALVDVCMPQLNGLDAPAKIKRFSQKTKIIYLTMLATPDVAAEAFRRGASGYLVKQSDAEELVQAIRTVVRGQSYLSSMITQDTVEFLLRTSADRGEWTFSGRQAEILQLLAEGKQMKEIALILHIDQSTVAFHKYKIMNALGAKTIAGVVEYAVKHHMIDNIRDERAIAVIHDRSELQRLRKREVRGGRLVV
jgi:DNA-binding NarL/FixJ family response regulator